MFPLLFPVVYFPWNRNQSGKDFNLAFSRTVKNLWFLLLSCNGQDIGTWELSIGYLEDASALKTMHDDTSPKKGASKRRGYISFNRRVVTHKIVAHNIKFPDIIGSDAESAIITIA
jgi:hypothetical protein